MKPAGNDDISTQTECQTDVNRFPTAEDISQDGKALRCGVSSQRSLAGISCYLENWAYSCARVKRDVVIDVLVVILALSALTVVSTIADVLPIEHRVDLFHQEVFHYNYKRYSDLGTGDLECPMDLRNLVEDPSYVSEDIMVPLPAGTHNAKLEHSEDVTPSDKPENRTIQ
jgi:hypothetical protein